MGTAGDVNGDGFADVIVGAPQYTHGETREGGAAVYHGSRYYYVYLPVILYNP